MTVSGSRVRALARILLFLLACLTLFPTYSLLRAFDVRRARAVQIRWCQWCFRICGLSAKVEGSPYAMGPTLYVSNHVSYLDIPVLGAFVDATFVAKSEVGDWPLFGTAAKITRTILINRVGAESLAQRAEMLNRLQAGENLLLFAEGTTGDGSTVLRFKSSLFSIAEASPPELALHIQPISLTYVRLRDEVGTPLVGPLRRLYCWFGDDALAPHLTRMMGLPGAVVEIRFHEPIPAWPDPDRKRLARQAEAVVAAGVAASNAPLLAEEGEAAEPAKSATTPAGSVKISEESPAPSV